LARRNSSANRKCFMCDWIWLMYFHETKFKSLNLKQLLNYCCCFKIIFSVLLFIFIYIFVCKFSILQKYHLTYKMKVSIKYEIPPTCDVIASIASSPAVIGENSAVQQLESSLNTRELNYLYIHSYIH